MSALIRVCLFLEFVFFKDNFAFILFIKTLDIFKCHLYFYSFIFFPQNCSDSSAEKLLQSSDTLRVNTQIKILIYVFIFKKANDIPGVSSVLHLSEEKVNIVKSVCLFWHLCIQAQTDLHMLSPAVSRLLKVTTDIFHIPVIVHQSITTALYMGNNSLSLFACMARSF